VFNFIIHRYIVSLSLSRSTFTMSVPPVSSSFQTLVGKSGSVLAPGVMTSDTTVSASSSGPVLPPSYFVRDSEQITASEALLVLQEGPRASESSLLAETIPETQDIPQTPDFEVIIPRRTTTADSRPSRSNRCDIASPLHTYG